MHDYSAIFAQRARQYHLAMQTHPAARDAEFAAALCDLPADAVDVLDVPSGGGYLQRHLPAQARLVSCDFSAGFATADVPLVRPGQLPYAAAAFDAVVSLTGLHHVAATEQDAFLRECRRVLRPGGRVMIGEVAAGSPVDGFLNGFVHAHNSQGHEGVFFDDGFLERLRQAGFSGCAHQLRAYRWRFADWPAALFFCRNLFGIDRADDATLRRGLESHLAADASAHGVQVPWQLLFFRADAPR